MFNNKTILITGGTGSFGKNFTKYILKKHNEIKKIIIYSRDELKQYNFKEELKKNKGFNKLRFFIGDVRDYERLKLSFDSVDMVIHAAALKQVDTAEYNPLEFIKTNINGTSNIINAAIDRKVKKLILLSTDKASSPVNLYGATKLCADKLFISASNYRGSKDIRFSVVRYGNVMGSRGSVIPKFIQDSKKKQITITNKLMTRFNITLNESINFVIKCLKEQQGGEIFIPKIPSYKIVDLAKAVAPNAKVKFVGTRPGEKLHEEMISEFESGEILEFKKLFIIKAISGNNYKYSGFGSFKKINSFKYSSDTNNKFLTIKDLKKLIKENLNFVEL